MNYASDEKLRVLRWLLPQLTADEIVAAELPFRDVRRKADLAILSTSRLAVIEIKGPRDNLGTLLEQVEDYRLAFLEVDVAVSTRFVATAREALPRYAGIIELADKFVIRRRRASIRTCLDSEGALHWLHAKDLRILLGTPLSRDLDLEELRAEARHQLSKKALSDAALICAYRRCRARYDAFSAERTDVLTLDDVAVLESPLRIR